MKKQSYVRVMLLGLAIFVPLLAFSLFYLNPKMGTTAIITFIVSIFFTLTFFVSLLGFLVRAKASNNEVIFDGFKTSLRQGFLVGFYFLGLLGLAAIRLLTWWDALLLALSLILFEIYFKSSKETKL